jgi:hypothetical protein
MGAGALELRLWIAGECADLAVCQRSDTARLHITGLVDPSVWSERIFALAGPADFQ